MHEETGFDEPVSFLHYKTFSKFTHKSVNFLLKSIDELLKLDYTYIYKQIYSNLRKLISRGKKIMERLNIGGEDHKYMSVAEFARRIGTHPQTVRRWDREGILKPHHVLPSGRRLYSEDQVDEIINKGIDMN